jgi:hypothetical protein
VWRQAERVAAAMMNQPAPSGAVADEVRK